MLLNLVFWFLGGSGTGLVPPITITNTIVKNSPSLVKGLGLINSNFLFLMLDNKTNFWDNYYMIMTAKPNFNNPDKSFNKDAWINFMNTAIQNIDDTLPTKNLRDSLLWKNNLSYRVSTFNNGWQSNHSLYDLEFIKQDKVLVKCEPEKELRIIAKNPKNKQSNFLLKKFTKFVIYYPKTNQIREIDMSEYAELGLKKYIIREH